MPKAKEVELLHGNKAGIYVGVRNFDNSNNEDYNHTDVILFKSPNDNVYDEIMNTPKLLKIIVI
jgi:hypothetical protein